MTGWARGLAARLHGRVTVPGEPGYDTVRRPLVGGMDEPLPAAVAWPVSAAEVAAALSCAAAAGVPVAVRGGGHSFADLSSTAGLLLDLRLMDQITPGRGRVTVGPGVRVAGLAGVLASVGRVVPVGWCPSVGVVGACLGGGFGPMGRFYGLGCDHVLGAEVVLASGDVVWVDAAHEPELFWALRGAGAGNFGVVTSLLLRTRPARRVTAFSMAWLGDGGALVAGAWQRWAPAAPRTVNAELVLVASGVPGTMPGAVVFGLVVGEPSRCAETLAEFTSLLPEPPRRRWVTPLGAREAATHHFYGMGRVPIEPPPAPAPGQRPGRRVVRSGFFAAPLPAAAIERLVEHQCADPVAGQYREIEFVPWGGALGERPATPAAFAHREPLFLVEHNADVRDEFAAGDAARVAVADWVSGSWEILRERATGGAFANYPDPLTPDWPAAAYGDGLARLAAVREAYDPDRRFRATLDLGAVPVRP